jgi:aminopeptidase N
VSHQSFDKNTPNTFRALVNTFAAGNPLPAAFHKKDGSGYAFLPRACVMLQAVCDHARAASLTRLCECNENEQRYEQESFVN